MLNTRVVTKNKNVIVTNILMRCLLVGASLMVSSNVWAEKFTLNFKGADIKAVITSVADITGKNFIVDPRVKGKATIISKRAMSKGEVYQVFLSVLEVHGYTAVPSGTTIKIIPDADAKHSGMPTVDEDNPGKGDEAVTRVIQIEHVTAAQLVPILRPLVPPQGHLAAYPQSNVLIISDRVRNINRLLSIIKRIDQPTSGEIEIVSLEHAAASDLVRVLNSLQQQKNQKGAKGNKPTLVADERTNSILIGGDRSQRLQLRAIISHLDTPSEVTGDTHVIYLRYAKAKDLVTVLTGVAESKKKARGGKGKKGGRGAAALGGAVLNIQADESSNALVITASPTVFRSLESVVRQLDVRRAQVLVEAIIAEISTGSAANLGVQWIFDGSNNDRPVGSVDFDGFVSKASTGLARTGSNSSLSNAAAVASVLGRGASLAFGRFSNKEGFNFAGILNALQSDANTNVLSTPSLVTLDNEEAEIFVGQEVSVPTGSFSNPGSGGGGRSTSPFTTFQRKPIGISLKVKPQINEGDAIQLEIEQKVDSLSSDPGSAGTGALTTAERRVKTNVIVDDGSILILGGLIKDDLIESHSKVPLLGDIPLIGFLFRSESVRKVKQNLMIFLRTTILRDAKQSLALTHSKYTAIREAQAIFNQDGSQLWLNGEPPELPEMEGLLSLPPPFEETQKSKKTLFDDPEETPDALDF